MSYLHRVNESHLLNALRVQERLWSEYHGAGQFQGISAIPSLHVALPTPFAWRAARPTGAWVHC